MVVLYRICIAVGLPHPQKAHCLQGYMRMQEGVAQKRLLERGTGGTAAGTAFGYTDKLVWLVILW
eukprot:6117810-Amphidinium_carterae.1